MTTDYHDLAILDSNSKTLVKISDANLTREKHENESWEDLSPNQKAEIYSSEQLKEVAATFLSDMLARDLVGTLDKLGLIIKITTLND